MIRVKTKVCGLVRPEDAAFCAKQGVDFLGLILAPSSRRVDLQQGLVIRRAAGDTALVGVFVDAPLTALLEAVEVLSLDLVQLHGGEDDAYCAAIRERSPVKIIRAINAGRQAQLPQADAADFYLIDLDKGLPQGRKLSELPYLWEKAARWTKDHGHRLFLAGGLTPQNVAQAVATVGPYAVDVAGGVEIEPGVKDHARVEAFLQEVRRCTVNHS